MNCARARELFAAGQFFEVYLDTSLAVCEARDPKGLYRMARSGKIADFTGIDSPYEVPEIPEVTLDTGAHDVDALVAQLLGKVFPERWPS